MSNNFDPYHRWLGIAPTEQPANHYRLLGIPLFETDQDVIETAADRQMSHVRTYQAGLHSELSQKILNQIASAKVCLLKPDKKKAYDDKLRGELIPPAAQQPTPPPSMGQPPASPSGQKSALPSWMQSARPSGQQSTPAAARQQAPRAAAPVDPGLANMFKKADRDTSHVAARLAKRRRLARIGAALFMLLGAAVVAALVMYSRELRENSSEPPEESATIGTEIVDPQEESATTVSEIPEQPTDPDLPASATDVDPFDTPVMTEPLPPVVNGDPLRPDPEDNPDPVMFSDVDPAMSGIGASDKAFGQDQQPGGGGPADDRIAVPSAEEQKQVASVLENTHNISTLATAEEKVELAEKLLDMAADPQVSSAERFMLLKTSADLAGEGGNAELMVRAVDAAGAAFDVDQHELKEERLVSFARSANSTALRESLVEATFSEVDDLRAADRPDLAVSVLGETLKACPPGRFDVDQRRRLINLQDEVKSEVGDWKVVEGALAALEADAEDADANLIAARWYCFRRGNFDKGLPYLARCGDQELAELATEELTSPPISPADQIVLGDAWWEAADLAADEDRNALKKHAGVWYAKALPGITSVSHRDKIAGRLDEIEALGSSVEGAIAGGTDTGTPSNMVTRTIDFSSDINPTKRFVTSPNTKPNLKGGKLTIAAGKEKMWTTFAESFKSISSVTIHGGILEGQRFNFCVAIGPRNFIFNSEQRDENHFVDLRLAKPRPLITRPAAFTPGAIHDLVISAEDGNIVVTINGEQHTTFPGTLEETVTVYTWDSAIVIEKIIIEGEPDPGTRVRRPPYLWQN